MNSDISPVDPARYVILVAMAFDETDQHALREAARLSALRPHSELHVVHAVIERGAATVTDELVSVDGRMQEAPKEMERRINALQAAWPQRVVAHVRVGEPARAILQTAADLDADVVVVGTHQRSGLKKLMLGSVAARVLENACCPVLVAVAKDHSDESRSEQIEPACPACLEIRKQTGGAQFWCEQHMHPFLKPHVYEPTERERTSASSMY